MRIGELSRRSGVSARSLRYYESEGMLSADRSPNGYRDYPEESVARAATIHSLFGMGFPRSVVTAVLACGGDVPPERHDDLAAELERVDGQLAARVAEMTRTRQAIAGFLTSRAAPR